MTYYTIGGLVKRGLPILILTCFMAVIVGQILGREEDILVSYPTLLIMLPVVMKIGGDTGSMFGARLSSAFHLGFSNKIRHNPVVRNNMIAVMIIGLVSSLFVCAAARLIDIYRGFDTPFAMIFAVSLCVYLLDVFFVYTMTVALSFASHRYGLDPDDTVIPVIASLGDLAGVVGVFIAAVLMFGLPY